MDYYWVESLSVGEQRIVLTGPYKTEAQAKEQAGNTGGKVYKLPTRNRNRAKVMLDV